MSLLFIGGGNMAGAIVGGLLQSGRPASEFHVVEVAAEARERVTAQFAVSVSATPTQAVVEAAACVVLAIKPQQMREVALSLKPYLAGQLVLSIAAGIRASDLARWLGGYSRIVRAMPNTPALVRAGCTGLYAMPGATKDDRAMAEAVLGAVGSTLWVTDEARLDAVTAISGSGPAYVFYFIEALQQAAQELGFSKEEAARLAGDTFAGAVKLAVASDVDVAELRRRVTSKGGTTERALGVLELEQVRFRIVAAVLAARDRSQELGAELGGD